MLDKGNSSHPALIAHELTRLNVDMAALSGVHLADEGSLQKKFAGFALAGLGNHELINVFHV